MRNSLKQFQKLGESVVRHTALLAKVMVIRGNEFVERHLTLRAVLQ